MTTSDLLAERNSTHGDFESNALISQMLKEIFHESDGWSKLTYPQKEALDMIALKVSRILSGNSDFADHWDDIIGYASLGRGVQLVDHYAEVDKGLTELIESTPAVKPVPNWRKLYGGKEPALRNDLAGDTRRQGRGRAKASPRT